MQAVTTAFKNAIVSNNIATVRSVLIELVDNQALGATITVTGDVSDSTNFPLNAADNSENVYGAKWAWADPFAEGAGGRYLADGTLFPFTLPNEGGWQGATLSDGAGAIAGSSYLNYLYSIPMTVQTFSFWADTFQGIPVDFVISYATNTTTVGAGLDLANIVVNITGNTLPQYTFMAATPITNIRQLRLRISRISYHSQPARLIEFQGSYTVDVSSDVDQMQLLTERYPDNSSLVVGNASAGEISLMQNNVSGRWGPNNLGSQFTGLLRANRKIIAKVGVKYADGSTELVPIGTFYSMKWQAPGGSAIATVTAQDGMKKLRDLAYRKCPLQTNKTVTQCIQQALADAGFGINQQNIFASSTVIPFAWASPDQSFFQYIQNLAAVDGGQVFFDENDIFHFQDALWLHNNSTVSQLTITDAIATIKADDEWTDGETRNRIVVDVNSLKQNASAQIWSLQETLTVPASGTLSYLIVFPNACTSTSNPVITVGGVDITVQSWTPFAQSGIVVLANANVSNAETVTGMTLNGAALVPDGHHLSITETAGVTAGTDTPRELKVNNPFIQNSTVAGNLGTNLLTLFSNPPGKLMVQCVGLPHLELGDRITVNSAQLGINADYWVIRHTFIDNGGFESQLQLYAAV